jgi:hypothetical protein
VVGMLSQPCVAEDESDLCMHIAPCIGDSITTVPQEAGSISNSWEQVGDGHCSLLQWFDLVTLVWHMPVGSGLRMLPHRRMPQNPGASGQTG